MVLKPQIIDLKIIGNYLGRTVIGLGMVMCIPLILALILGEINPAIDFVISLLITFILGIGLVGFCSIDREPRWMHGMIVVALSWLFAMFLGAIPLFLSGHYGSYLDSCFEAMSGFATTGLTLVQDLNHLSYAHNFWRHFIMFIGGQGIVIMALSFLISGSSGAFKMYIGEAREEKILPNVVSTAKVIWIVSLVYLILGSSILTIVGLFEGLPLKSAIFHGICIFMTAFDTGGFSPQSQNILYYHSFYYEIVTIMIMLLGAINFKLHYAILTGNRREIFKNIETVTLFFSIILIFIITSFGLKLNNQYPQVVSFFRKGFYQFISAHTGTGFATIYSEQFRSDWSTLALVGIIIAMSIGGSSCSTTGAIKTIRVGLIFKGLKQNIKRIILPESAVFSDKFHHIKDIILEDKHILSATLMVFLYFGLYFFGALVAMLFGYPFLESLFESTSAAANVGLSCGITKVTMPAVLKITYILQMWIGRLEFTSVFTLFGFILAAIKGK
ncbi:MAG: TrkH family potassium uptake protein [Candidatus Omnitrophica bacterium]|nr:TrkH family potassium uptake protein [Candidatus Omnitrophota bacterium]